jgi:hypothetical protein
MASGERGAANALAESKQKSVGASKVASFMRRLWPARADEASFALSAHFLRGGKFSTLAISDGSDSFFWFW